MLDRTRAYTRGELEAALGEPAVAINGRDPSAAPWGRGMTDSELPIHEEPIAGLPYWLLWRCEKHAGGRDCWAIGDVVEDTWPLVMLCSMHDLRDPYRGRIPSAAEIVKRRAWIERFWDALSVLDGLERSAPAAANYQTYHIELDEIDEQDPSRCELAEFSIRAQTQAPACGHYAFSVQNCAEQHAALVIVRALLQDADAEIWVSGGEEPMHVRVGLDAAQNNTFGRTPQGDVVAMPFDRPSGIVRIRAT